MKKTRRGDYVAVHDPLNASAHRGYVYEHVRSAEQALGKRLPSKAQVHHVNGNKHDNSNRNLVICENRGYHMILHRRAEALHATGHPEYRRCPFCLKWDPPEKLKKSGHNLYHAACRNERKRTLYLKKKLQSEAGGTK